jgi:hypothetical protein
LTLVAACGSASPTELTDRGYVALGQSDYGAAADHFQAALKGLESDDPYFTRSSMGLVRALAHFQPEQALDQFLEFATSNPERASEKDYANISKEMFDAGGQSEAIRLLDSGVKRFDSSDLEVLMDHFEEESMKSGNPEALAALEGLGYLGD